MVTFAETTPEDVLAALNWLKGLATDPVSIGIIGVLAYTWLAPQGFNPLRGVLSWVKSKLPAKGDPTPPQPSPNTVIIADDPAKAATEAESLVLRLRVLTCALEHGLRESIADHLDGIEAALQGKKPTK